MRPTFEQIVDRLRQGGLLLDAVEGEMPGDTVFSDISFDNRTLRPGSLFVCKGAAFKEEYLRSALEQGALIYMSEQLYNVTAPYILVSDIRLAMSSLAATFFEEGASRVKKIGITGTKGKSTVASFLNTILDDYSLEQYSRKSALISSLRVFDGVVDMPSALTTPEAIDLWRYLDRAGQNGMRYAVCEVSSQALKYHRVKDVSFDIALFLNIGIDHISEIEHPDFDDYFASKLSIFSQTDKACLFSSGDFFEEIQSKAREAGSRVFTFGYRENDTLRLLDVTRTDRSQIFTVCYHGCRETYEIGLFGRHNIENAMSAILAAKLLGVSNDSIRRGLAATRVAGRGVELTSQDGLLRVIVDYAHNGMSLEALYRYVENDYPDYRVITVFGCPGGKAKNRRRDMALVSAKHSDLVILTEDDPGKESVEDINKEIAAYLIGEGVSYLSTVDRQEAIRLAFSMRFKKTVILLCGKGQENTQKRGNTAVPYETDEFFAKQELELYHSAIVPIG